MLTKLLKEINEPTTFLDQLGLLEVETEEQRLEIEECLESLHIQGI